MVAERSVQQAVGSFLDHLTVEQIGLTPEDSLLDAIFGNVLGTPLALPSQPNGPAHPGCKTPDIDVDRDGLEIFCDTDSDNTPYGPPAPDDLPSDIGGDREPD